MGPYAKGKLAIERMILESKIPYTIVNVAPQMDEVITPDHVAGKRTSLITLVDPAMRFSYISRDDLGRAIGKIFMQRKVHYYATYQLVGTQTPLGMNEIAEKVRHELGYSVEAIRLHIVDPVEMLRSGDKTFTAEGLRYLQDEVGWVIPPLDIGPSRSGNFAEARNESAALSTSTLAANIPGDRDEVKQKETMARRHAMGPNATRPTYSELGVEENDMAPQDKETELPGNQDATMEEAKEIVVQAGVTHGEQNETHQERAGRIDSLAYPPQAHPSTESIKAGESATSRPVSPPTHAEVHGPPPVEGAAGNITGADISNNRASFAGPPIYPNISIERRGAFLSRREEEDQSAEKTPTTTKATEHIPRTFNDLPTDEAPPKKVYAYRQPNSEVLLIDPRLSGREETFAEIAYRSRNGGVDCGVGLVGNSNTLRYLIKKEPESFDAFLVRRKREWEQMEDEIEQGRQALLPGGGVSLVDENQRPRVEEEQGGVLVDEEDESVVVEDVAGVPVGQHYRLAGHRHSAEFIIGATESEEEQLGEELEFGEILRGP
ncbi:hypothetical protein PRZ48_003985 [Zasmidium cellare]|uniref:Uncharacterized protein n=1 Tax=Zasmidium cellare TaxID=395010 RepID=A0ABR0EXV2_ZASCE|nr:hypothetical protein PRZ48_003985 [Zasmidium cellare]